MESKVPSFIESETSADIHSELQSFETEFDDLREAEGILNEYWDKNIAEIQRNDLFEEELELFQNKLRKIKKCYKEFIKSEFMHAHR